ncbi:hypothetical protein POTOM_012741 [Populus tomentosa]|uniref:WAT1-related protein n=1 Tax=Populus tomentosa TaxID=118781 RepID=A0A8X8AAI2_POPTO|nr:hypothetical protein POTOM_012741 [Populus tomentosa]
MSHPSYRKQNSTIPGAKMGVKVAVLPIVGMIMAECAQAGRMIAGKAAMSNGMSSFVFVLYSNTIASTILLPSSLIFHRPQERPPLTLSIVFGFFLLGLFGCLGQSFGYAGINLSSPALGTAMLNTVPGLTFVLAVIFRSCYYQMEKVDCRSYSTLAKSMILSFSFLVFAQNTNMNRPKIVSLGCFRMEKVDCRSYSTLAKSMGTIISMGGAFVVTFYKGPLLLKALPSASNSSHLVLSQHSNWVLGGLLLAVDCTMASSWLIVQGILGHAFQVGVTTWCLQKTGPVFVSVFAPLGIVITATASVVFSGDALNLGIVIGAVIIASGFYAVIWGKAQEATKKVEDEESLGPASSSQKVPLLQNRSNVDA